MKRERNTEIKKKSNFKRFINFLFPEKKSCENIFQYFIRQFLVPDSSGTPSITVTILYFTMLIVGIVTFKEFQLAGTEIIEKQGNKIIISVKGFSETFIYLVIGLSVVITGWYRSRQKNNGENGQIKQILSGDTIKNIKKYVESVVSKIPNDNK